MVFLFFASLSVNLHAQEIKVTAHLDTNNVRIGDQVRLVLDATHVPGTTLYFPLIPDTMGKVEVISKGSMDTVKTNQSIQSYSQKVVVTSFDSGAFTIPSFKFSYRKQKDTTLYSVQTDSLTFFVKGIPVDTSQEIKDIKPPMEVPFSWKEFLKENAWYIAGGLVFILFVALLFYWLKNRKKPMVVEKPVPSRPAHLIAMEKLEQLDSKRLWQQGELKAYHSEISDILRTYIEHRFGINAMELTTDETMSALQRLAAADKDDLKQVLHLSDLVKFAKGQPIPTENELSMRLAKEFVAHTKLNDEVKVKEGEGAV